MPIQKSSFTSNRSSLSESLFQWAGQRAADKAKRVNADAYESARSTGGSETLEQKKPILGIFDRDRIEAHNAGLRDAYIAGIDSDNVNRIGQISIENSDNVQGYDAAIDGLMGGLSKEVDPSVRDLILKSAQEQADRSRLRIQEAAFNNQARTASDSRKASAEVYSNDAASKARMGDEEGAAISLMKNTATLDAMLESGDIGQDQYNFAKRDAEREATEQGHLGRLSNESVEESQAWVSENKDKIPKGFTPDEWDSFIGRAEAGILDKMTDQNAQLQAQKLASTQALNELEIQINTGQGSHEDQLAAIDKLYQGRPTDAKYVSLKTKVIDGIQETIKTQDMQGDIIARLGGDESMVIDHKTADNMYESSPRTPAESAFIADRLKYVPAPLKSEISNGLASSDPDLIMQSADMMSRLDQTRGLTDTFTDDDRAFAQQVTKLLPYMLPEEAVKLARSNTDPRDAARIDARHLEIKDEDWAKDYPSQASSAVTGFFSKLDDWNAPQITSDYKELFESLYVSGMDKDAAEDKAADLLASQWSRYDGKYMKYNPADFYSVGGSAEYVKTQAISELLQTTWIPGEIEDIYFFSDDRTAREASEGQPSYLVRYKTADGWQLHGDRFIPDVDAERSKVSNEIRSGAEERRERFSIDNIAVQEREARLNPEGI